MVGASGRRPTSTAVLRGALRRARRATRRVERVIVAGEVDRRRALIVAAIAAVAAILGKAALNAVLAGDSGFIVLPAAVVIATWSAGWTAGAVTTVLIALLNLAIFTAPIAGSDPLAFQLDPIDLTRAVLFSVAGLGIAYVVATLRLSRDRFADSLAATTRMAVDIERRDERLELALATSGMGFWEWDITTGTLIWSRTIFDQHGLDPDGPVPTYDAYLATIHPDDREAFDRQVAAALEGGSMFSRQFRIVWADGSVHWTHGVGRVFQDATGRPVRMVGTGQDITERRRIEEERDALVAEERRGAAFREAFLEVISHELRTPITTILGLTQVLRRPRHIASLGADAHLIDDVSEESERLHRLVEDLLVLTRAERGQMTVESEPMQLGRLVERVVAREGARLPSLSITLDLAPGLPVVAGEETYVEQIIRNMLGNAAKYTPPGTRVAIAAAPDGDDVAVRVLDDGPGISDDAARHAFELFYRDPERARHVAGSGIGLFVCASLVEAMGGRIWARQAPGGGSEFGFTLRAVDEDDPTLDDAAPSADPVAVATAG